MYVQPVQLTDQNILGLIATISEILAAQNNNAIIMRDKIAALENQVYHLEDLAELHDDE